MGRSKFSSYPHHRTQLDESFRLPYRTLPINNRVPSYALSQVKGNREIYYLQIGEIVSQVKLKMPEWF